ncbi:MAG: ABC transporter permease [Pseudomonadota bacterium]
MSLTHFISSRFNARASLPRSIRAMRAVAMTGIAIAVAALVVATSIGRGFENRYRRALMDFNAHIVVMGGGEIEDSRDVTDRLGVVRYSSGEDASFARRWAWALPCLRWLDHLSGNPAIGRFIPASLGEFEKRVDDAAGRGVLSSTPFLYREALSVGGGKIRGVVVKGIDPATVRDVNGMSITLFDEGRPLEAAMGAAGGEGIPVVAGRALAREFGVDGKPFDLKLMIPKLGKGQKGGRQFETVRIVGTFESGMQDYDAQFILMALPQARRLFHVAPGVISGVELKLDDPQRADEVAARIDEKMGPHYRGITWSELNRELLSAVRLERLVSAVIMGIMVVVAALNIVAVLVLMTIYRFHEISILKALGLPERRVLALLTRGGSLIGLWGVLAGLAIGIGIAEAAGRLNLIPLEPDIYLIASLPIDISPLICGMITLFCIAVGFLTSLSASRSLSRIPVAEGLQMGR